LRRLVVLAGVVASFTALAAVQRGVLFFLVLAEIACIGGFDCCGQIGDGETESTAAVERGQRVPLRYDRAGGLE
jgi:hypothetical protein